MPRPSRSFPLGSTWPILAAVAVLVTVGVISISAVDPGGGRRQLVFLAIALAAMFILQAMDYRRVGRLAWPFFLGGLALVLYTVLGSVLGGVPGVTIRNGAYNWIDFGPANLQPAELLKIGFVLVMARYLRYRKNYRTLGGLIPPFLLAGVPVALILKQPDLGTALVFIPVLFVMLYVAGARLRHLAAVVGLGLLACPLLWLSGTNLPLFRHGPEFVKGYQRERVYAMFNNDEQTLQETGFQQHNALIAFGSGGMFGKGAGVVPVGSKVPESQNDMVFAVVGEQFGFTGAFAVVFCYAVLFATGAEIASNTREPFGRLVALGMVALLAGQTFLNLAVATKLMPVTGVTLPFISSGGSSLIASFMAVGLLLNVARNKPFVMANDSFEYED